MMMRINHLPRVSLAHLPTPLEEMPRLGACLGVKLWVKRDDCTGLAFGGNKTRKLEFAIGEAMLRNANTIVAASGYQSNFLRQTAAASAKLGLDFHAVISTPAPGRGIHYYSSGNLLLDHVMGATLHIATDDGAATEKLIADLMLELRAAGRSPFHIPSGASDAIGSVGYVNCAKELVEQCKTANITPGAIVIVTGSGGGQAGLLVGLRSLGLNTKVIGVSCSETSEIKRTKVKNIVGPLIERINGNIEISDDEIIVYDDYSGGGYAIPTLEANDAVIRTASSEGVILDPIYTGKGMAALIDLVARNELPARDPIIFIHTGGAPALFVYEDLFWTGLLPKKSRR